MNRHEGPARIPTDEEILAELTAGSSDRFALLVERYSTDLFQFVARFIRNPAVVEDVVQESFIQVYQSAGGFDSSRKFRPWLFTIAANIGVSSDEFSGPHLAMTTFSEGLTMSFCPLLPRAK